MSSISKIRHLIVASLLSVGVSLGSGVANASDCHQPHVYYKTVIVYETVRQPIVCGVTKYDQCGIPYRAKVVTYTPVQIPVQKRVRAYF